MNTCVQNERGEKEKRQRVAGLTVGRIPATVVTKRKTMPSRTVNLELHDKVMASVIPGPT